MGKSMYNFGKMGKEKARQQKQLAKTAKRTLAKQQKGNLKTVETSADSDIAEPGLVEKNG
jgi:bacillopeptidase F (M6 metalloprotease family)